MMVCVSIGRFSIQANPNSLLIFTVYPDTGHGENTSVGKNRRSTFGSGISTECVIALPNDSMVSRQHARLFYNGTSWYVEDSGSSNGVYVNGQKIMMSMLQRGDAVTVGFSTLRLE
jgi:pSer/pThr/pTyr-binding forkhead associated (FHA) protein